QAAAVDEWLLERPVNHGMNKYRNSHGETCAALEKLHVHRGFFVPSRP
ncbi:hypothetical protein ABH924_005058, partial [Arthrobacter sp. GAS37]